MAEQRRFRRVPTRLKVWCEGEDFTLLAEATNASKRGLFVRTSSAPPPTRRLKVTIEDLAVTADAEVRWVRPGHEPGRAGMGLHILTFERGAHAYEQFVEGVRTPSGEHRISWPPPGEDE
jgi:hypothetical protein